MKSALWWILLAATGLMAGSSLLAQNTIAQGKNQSRTESPPSSADASLTAPLTSENSILSDFGYGVVLRVPRVLFSPDVVPRDLRVPLRTRALSMNFMFPDMTLTDQVAGQNLVWEKLRNEYPFRPDRFPVLLFNLGYLPRDGKTVSDAPQLDPTPTEVEDHLDCCLPGSDGHPTRVTMARLPSSYPGLLVEITASALREHPDYAHRPDVWRRYIAAPGATYDLSMLCDHPGGGRCVAYVLSKKRHFQYRLIFPPEAVGHTDDVIQLVEKLLEQWSTI